MGDARLISELSNGFVKSVIGSALAALNKWAKAIISAPNRTMHSLRHALRDQLRAVNCSNEVSKAIGGWSEGNACPALMDLATSLK